MKKCNIFARGPRVGRKPWGPPRLSTPLAIIITGKAQAMSSNSFYTVSRIIECVTAT